MPRSRAPLLGAAHHRPGLPDGDVLEERKNPARAEQARERIENLLDRFHAEIIERQPGNNQVIRLVGGHLLHALVQHPAASRTAANLGSAPKCAHAAGRRTAR